MWHFPINKSVKNRSAINTRRLKHGVRKKAGVKAVLSIRKPLLSVVHFLLVIYGFVVWIA